MTTDRVVVVLEPVLTLSLEPRNVGPGASVNQLLLIRREEGFRDGIVVTLTG